jgi:hypothetical protein
MVDIDPAVKASWQDLLDDKSETTFVVFGYAADGKSIVGAGSGGDGLGGLKAALPADEVRFGGFRCTAVDSSAGAGAERRSTKFVFVSWVGEGVGALKKAKTSFHKQAVTQALSGIHLELQVSALDELEEEAIQATIIDNAGARAWGGVEFGRAWLCLVVLGCAWVGLVGCFLRGLAFGLRLFFFLVCILKKSFTLTSNLLISIVPSFV